MHIFFKYYSWFIAKLEDAVPQSVQLINMSSTDIILSPNPTNGLIKIQNVNVGSAVRIYNILGDDIKVEQLLNANTVQLDLSDMPKGIYMVEIKSNSSRITKKVVLN